MIPHFEAPDLEMFKRYMKNSKVYFEYGSGGSTYHACNLSNVEKIYSVESDPEWINKIKSSVGNVPKCNFIYIDMDSRGNWGYPGKKCTSEQRKNYSGAINTIDSSHIDLVLIDGRFRVACALKCFKLDNCILIIDDFLNRPYYHIILQFYDIVEKGKIMICLKKKQGINPPSDDIVKKYELIAE